MVVMHQERPGVVDEEYRFRNGIILSETDLRGTITYANRRFCQISGYERQELIGSSHNIIRHPDMPKAAFRELWDTIRKEKVWEGIIKNLRKDGRYYWVHTHIEPLRQNGSVTGYIAVRRPADVEEIAEAERKYKALLIQEKARN